MVFIYLGINTNIISNVLLFFADFTSEGIADKIESYAVTKTRLGFLIPVFIYGCYLVFIKIINNKLIKDDTTVVRKRSIKNFIYSSKNNIIHNRHFLKVVEQINIIGICYLPFNILLWGYFDFVIYKGIEIDELYFYK